MDSCLRRSDRLLGWDLAHAVIMPKIINNQLSIINCRGSVLLVVLFVIMAITVLSVGFLTRSDAELACGQNMALRIQMDQLADSGLQHAKGLILNPQDIDISSGSWSATKQQLVEGTNDYYDVNVTTVSDNYCNFNLDCSAYRKKGDDPNRIGQSRLVGEIRLDPCIALWVGTSATLWSGITVHGDVYCNDGLVNQGTICGDVFATALTGSGTKTGQHNPQVLTLKWPAVTVDYFSSKPGVSYYSSDHVLTGGLPPIEGMLLVNGKLTVQNTNNVIVAGKNMPALLVTGDLIIDQGASLEITGLAVANNRVWINGDIGSLNILGGLFVQNTFVAETAADSSGNGNTGILHNGTLRQPSGGTIGGAFKFDGVDDYVQVDNKSNFDITNQITVAAWIKVNAFTKNFQAIVTKGDSAWRIQRYGNTNFIEFACTGLTHNQYGNIWGATNVNNGQWHHVAGVYDGTKIHLYVDGNPDVTPISTSGSIRTNSHNVMIGENAEKTNRYWYGWIDDVRVYNRGLTAGEISIIKGGGAVSGLVAYWKLDETGSRPVTITAEPAKTAIIVGPQDSPHAWSQAAGAFFRSIRRQ